MLRKEEASESFAAAIRDAIQKMTEDGRVQAIQEKWLGSYTELPLDVAAE